MNWIKRILFKKEYKQMDNLINRIQVLEAEKDFYLKSNQFLIKQIREELWDYDELISLLNEELTQEQHEEMQSCCDSFRD
jgi:hypothetical protein